MTTTTAQSGPSDRAIADYLRYEPETGLFYWIKTSGHRISAGSQAGTNSGGIRGIQIGFAGKRYRAARLAWRLMTGEWPPNQIDHINGNPIDNRWENLRPATQHENMQNTTAQSRNRSGLIGVSTSGKKYRARIGKNGKQIEIGRFDSADEAHEAYKSAKREMHTFNREVR